MNTEEKLVDVQDVDSDPPFVGTPASVPMVLLYVANGLYHYAGSCCDANNPPHSGLIVSASPLATGCGVSPINEQGIDPPGGAIAPARKTEHSECKKAEKPDERKTEHLDHVPSPQKIYCDRLDRAGSSNEFVRKCNMFKVSHPLFGTPDVHEVVQFMGYPSQNFQLRRISCIGFAEGEHGPIPYMLNYYCAMPTDEVRPSRRLRIRNWDNEEPNRRVVWVTAYETDPDASFPIVVTVP